MDELITKFVMWWLSKECKKYGKAIFYIKGTGKDYPRYLLYTENEAVRNRMDEF